MDGCCETKQCRESDTFRGERHHVGWQCSLSACSWYVVMCRNELYFICYALLNCIASESVCVLLCNVLYCIVLECIVLECNVLYCIVLHLNLCAYCAMLKCLTEQIMSNL